MRIGQRVVRLETSEVRYIESVRRDERGQVDRYILNPLGTGLLRRSLADIVEPDEVAPFTLYKGDDVLDGRTGGLATIIYVEARRGFVVIRGQEGGIAMRGITEVVPVADEAGTDASAEEAS
jgi:hypothetical protein